MCNTYAAVRPFIRDNTSPRSLKKRPYYIIDSSYMTAANPNSMRDSGPLRNAKYYIPDPADEYIRR